VAARRDATYDLRDNQRSVKEATVQKRDKVMTLLGADAPRERVLVKGWVRARRDAKGLSFLELNDGSCLGSIQVIAEAGLGNYAEVKDLGTGAAIAVEGKARRLARERTALGGPSR
jgi:aspartyl/asparaginyl-tRNA synthetase